MPIYWKSWRTSVNEMSSLLNDSMSEYSRTWFMPRNIPIFSNQVCVSLVRAKSLPIRMT